ncbi:peptide/nickel transport system substrate-binding protein [Roseomonas rosea]|uniref:Peptide/nickel transport system substrate-binding protein n=1 Tax=Muricoccus roseus TaxID=198092 RepID=A0A1M6DK45_9PROT|nr:ABC transporter substrate-binding protein [Roseomonas rosea]SHI73419.1 peptide/nickel transport system substrate-binding protein [Roseomonas rosea]
MQRRSLLKGAALSALPLPALAQPARARTLRFVPQAALTALDPIVQNATISTTHGFCVFDTLYATDAKLAPRPQMASGHAMSPDGLLWTIRLRDGLRFHDGAPVLSRDAVASLQRWCVRDLFGQILARAVAEWGTPDDRTLTIRLRRPFPSLLYALAKPAGIPPFIMPERLARTAPDRPVPEIVGSGPWKFVAPEFNPGSFVAYARNEAYVARDEPAEGASGGKRVHFDRLEWHIIPDGATAGAALQRGEVDWVEYPLPDLLPLLARDRNIRTQIYDPIGFLGVIRFNHLHPPFDKVEVRRAVRDCISQPDHMAAVAAPGDWRECHALFPCTLPGVTEFPAPPRDFDKARAAIRAAGMEGAKVVVINPTDFAAVAPQGRLAADVCRQLGFRVDLQEMDWAAMLSRRNSREDADHGGWSIYPTNFPAASIANPAVNSGIRGDGPTAWFGWPTDPATEAEIERWLYAPDAAAQAAAFAAVQRTAWDHVGFAPSGLFVLKTGFRADLSGVLQGPNPYLWNLGRG